MKKGNSLMKSAVLALILLGFASAASAKDAMAVAVTSLGSPTPIMSVNGNPYAAGNFAVGTIQLFYTVQAFQFTAGNFASFQVNLQDISVNNQSPLPSYPVALNLTQTGSSNLTLTPVPSSFSVTGVGWTGSSIVTISIPSSVPGDPDLNVDGADLVGNLQLVTVPSGSKLGTTTTVQVHIKLVHPTACLKVYDFFTNPELTVSYDSVLVHTNKTKVVSANPGQLSQNILVANTCGSSESFDLTIGLSPNWDTNPNGNPGNAVFTFYSTSTVDPNSFSISVFGTGTGHQQHLCLPSITLPAGQSFLAAVHMALITGVDPSTLPSSGIFTGFSGELDNAGSTSNCTVAGSLLGVASPNPVTATLPFTVQ